MCKHQARSESPREGLGEDRPGSSEASSPSRLLAPGTIGGGAPPRSLPSQLAKLIGAAAAAANAAASC